MQCRILLPSAATESDATMTHFQLTLILFCVTAVCIAPGLCTQCNCGTEAFSWRCAWKCFNSACPAWLDEAPKTHAVRVHEALTSELFGQTHAIESITNGYLSRRGDKPLSFHFAGTNGVGKSTHSRGANSDFLAHCTRQPLLAVL